jgi:hypothetical protein
LSKVVFSNFLGSKTHLAPTPIAASLLLIHSTKIKDKLFQKEMLPFMPELVASSVLMVYLSTEQLALKFNIPLLSSGGQISTKHLKTSIRTFFATCRLPQNPEFWRCYRPRHTFLGPHWKRSLKILDTLLTSDNTQHPTATSTSQNVAVILNIFFLGVYMFFI